MTNLMQPNVPRRRPETEAFLRKTILHPMFQDALKICERVHRTYGYQPMGAMILGNSGLGKTTIVKHYANKFTRGSSEDTLKQTILMCNIPAVATTKGLAAELLAKLGDPAPDKGTEQALYRRITKLAKARGVEMIILDEIHHLLPENSMKQTRTVANSIKNLMSNLEIPILLVGLETASVIGIEHEEFQRRFASIFTLKAFNIRTEQTAAYFKQYITQVETALKDVGVASIPLTSTDMLLRIFLASRGKPALVSALVEEALENRIEDSGLDMGSFAEAFDNRIYSVSIGFRDNPFRLTPSELKQRVKDL